MNKKDNLSFVILFGNKNGYGHIFRSLAISNFLMKNFNITFHINIINNHLKKIIYNQNKNIRIKKFNNLSKIENNHLVIIDKLNNDYKFINELSLNNNKIIIYDDKYTHKIKNVYQINTLYFPSGFNFNSFIKQKVIPHILTKKINYEYKFRTDLKKILFIQGGGDPHKNLLKILDILLSIVIKNNNIIFIFHFGYNVKGYLEAKKNKYPLNIKFTNSSDNFENIIKDIDLVVTSVGLNALDFIHYNIPSIYLTNEQKELETSSFLSKIGVGYNFGKLYKNKSKNFLKILNSYIINSNLRKKLYNYNKKYKINGLDHIRKIL